MKINIKQRHSCTDGTSNGVRTEVALVSVYQWLLNIDEVQGVNTTCC